MFRRSTTTLLPILIALLLSACAQLPPAPAATREHDKRNAFVPATTDTTFAAMPGLSVETDRWAGALGGAGYRIEVPIKNWNGKLAVYAHGYAGIGNTLTVQDPRIRRYLIENGYA